MRFTALEKRMEPEEHMHKAKRMRKAPVPQARVSGLGAALLCLLLLTGCEAGDLEDLKMFVTESGSDMRGMVEAPPETHPAPAIDFKGTGPQPQPFDPARTGQPRPDAKARRHG